MTSALAAARERLEAWMLQQIPLERQQVAGNLEYFQTRARRMLDEIERCARAAAIQQWITKDPF